MATSSRQCSFCEAAREAPSTNHALAPSTPGCCSSRLVKWTCNWFSQVFFFIQWFIWLGSAKRLATYLSNSNWCRSCNDALLAFPHVPAFACKQDLALSITIPWLKSTLRIFNMRILRQVSVERYTQKFDFRCTVQPITVCGYHLVWVPWRQKFTRVVFGTDQISLSFFNQRVYSALHFPFNQYRCFSRVEQHNTLNI